MLWAVEKALLEVAGDVFRDQRGADFLCLERRHLLVQRADLDALGIIEYRAVDGAGNVVFGKLGGGADIDDLVEVRQIGNSRALGFHRTDFNSGCRAGQR